MDEEQDRPPDLSIGLAMNKDGSTAILLTQQGEVVGEMPPEDAFRFAIAMVRSAFYAHQDADLYEWFVEAMDMSSDQAVLSVKSFREFCVNRTNGEPTLFRTKKTHSHSKPH